MTDVIQPFHLLLITLAGWLNLWVSNSQLRRHWKLDKPAAMRLPVVTL